MAQRSLAAAGIRCVRIDGSDSLLSRERTIQEFREDEGIKVILVSISCGGVGWVCLAALQYLELTETRLDLTVASRVHLLEPQWNPAIEEQALSRVHRMGQHRPVVTMRYVMKDSIEEVRYPSLPCINHVRYCVTGSFPTDFELQSVASVKGKKQLLIELLPQTALDLHLDERRS